MKIEKLKPGSVAYTITRHRMGNTTIRTVSIHQVKVREIDPSGRFVVASWNWNSPEKFYRHDVSKWRENEPMTIKGLLGQCRLATREEIKARKQLAASLSK